MFEDMKQTTLEEQKKNDVKERRKRDRVRRGSKIQMRNVVTSILMSLRATKGFLLIVWWKNICICSSEKTFHSLYYCLGAERHKTYIFFILSHSFRCTYTFCHVRTAGIECCYQLQLIVVFISTFFLTKWKIKLA